MLDTRELEVEAERLATRLRYLRCCDALTPCYRCSLLRRNLVARRRVLLAAHGPQTPPARQASVAPWALLARTRDLQLRAS